MKAILASLLIAAPAYAQEPQCTGLPDALAALAGQYQEAPRVSGLTSAGTVMLITASPNGGFSVLIVTPDGKACMVASGTNLEVQDAEAPGSDS
jgi:hypothetical protein